MGGERRGMRCPEHQVLGGIDRFGLVLRGLSPQQEDHFLALLVDDRDDLVGELLPAALGVRVGLAVLDREGGVEQEDALLRPLAEVAVLGHRELDLLVAAQVLVDVLERGRRRHWLEHAEAEPVRLAGLVVGILPDDDDLDGGDGRHLEGVEDVLLLGVDLRGILLTFLPDSYSALP